MTTALHILSIYDSPEFPGSVSRKQCTNPQFFIPRQQIYTDGISSHIDAFYADGEPALGSPGLQLGKADIFPLDAALVGIDI